LQWEDVLSRQELSPHTRGGESRVDTCAGATA
jgi:hypothetical protein